MNELTRILTLAARDIPAAGADCLLVGGFAVNYYGYTRNTLDVEKDLRPLCDRFASGAIFNEIVSLVEALKS